MVIRSSAA
ncbi:hypothetical protein A2U01_0055125, partial [Trifolium medium]|nr:hypothetical protein [Trifolium medium]